MQMLIIYFLVSISLSSSTTPSILARARVKDGEKYFEDVMQEVIYEMERREWASLKLLDFNQTLNEQMYDWLVSGTVTYTNGFLVSIQNIDLTAVSSSVSSNATIPSAIVRGTLNLRDVRLGFDVIANLTDGGVQHFTLVVHNTLIEFSCIIQKLYNTNTTVTTAMLLGLESREKYYMPNKKVTEVLSRVYIASAPWNGIVRWGTEVMEPIMSELVTTRFPFPQVCFNHC